MLIGLSVDEVMGGRQQSVNHQGQGLLCNLPCATTVVLREQLNFKSAVIRSERSSCLFFLLSALRASYGKLRFPQSSPFGRRPFERIGFQPTRHTIACLQFDHAQRFESTTDRFALRLYGEFNWKFGQIGFLCSL